MSIQVSKASTETDTMYPSLRKCKCSLCKRMGCMRSNSHKIKATTLCILILKTLKEMKPEKEYFSMKQDIYTFVSDHRSCLTGFSIFDKPNWKKMLLDTFNHCTKIETGKTVGLRASFRLKNNVDQQKTEASETSNESVGSSEPPSAFRVSYIQKQILFNTNYEFNEYGVYPINQVACQQSPEKK